MDIVIAEIFETARRKFTVLLTVFKLVLTVVALVLTALRRLLTVAIFAVFAIPELLILTIADESVIRVPLLILPAKRVPIVKLLAFPVVVLINPELR